MAIYKRDRGFELGTTENKSCKRPERDSNPGPSDCESDTLTTLPRCLLGISDSLSYIADSKAQDPRFYEQNFSGFPNPDSLS